MNEEENKINLTDPGTLIFFIMAFVADLCLLGLLAIAIPGVGLAIAAFVLMTHWGIGLIITVYFWGKSHGWLAKFILLLFWILPIPLTVGLVLMMIASNKIGAILIEQAAILTLSAATAGGGLVVEAPAVAVEGAEVAATVAEGAEAVAEGAEAAGAVGEAAEGAGAATEAAGPAGTPAPGGAGASGDFYDNPYENPMGTTKEDLLEPSEDKFHEGEGFRETEAEKAKPQEEPNEKGSDKEKSLAEKLKKVPETLDRMNQQQPSDKDEEEEKEGEEQQELVP